MVPRSRWSALLGGRILLQKMVEGTIIRPTPTGAKKRAAQQGWSGAFFCARRRWHRNEASRRLWVLEDHVIWIRRARDRRTTALQAPSVARVGRILRAGPDAPISVVG